MEGTGLVPGSLERYIQDVWAHKISALYLLYFHSYETFSDLFSDFHTKISYIAQSHYSSGVREE